MKENVRIRRKIPSREPFEAHWTDKPLHLLVALPMAAEMFEPLEASATEVARETAVAISLWFLWSL